MVRDTIHAAIVEALAELGAPDVSFVVERPAEMEHGDYATNAALAAAKILKKNPRDVAVELKEKLVSQLPSTIKKIEVAGVGFINFTLADATVKEVVHKAHEPEWGSGSGKSGKLVLVEYTSPNLFKPLHIGNLVGNILGESIARLFEASGATVKRLNYPSDIGLTVAKGVWGLWKNNLDPSDITQLGKAYVLGNYAYDNDADAKKEIEDTNKALYENSNPTWGHLRSVGIETSRTHLDDLCKKLGTTFDKEFFESESGPVGKEIVTKHVGTIFEESEGAVVYKGEADGLHTRVFLNSAGLPTYEAKEVGLFELKSKAYPDFDVSIVVTGSEQRDFFRVVFAAIQKVFANEVAGKELIHIANGFLRLTTGKMSSRLGNIITGESLIADLTEEARGRQDVAIGAIKYAVLKSGSDKNIMFDPEKSLSLEGDSGPYVQYALVRARAVLRKALEATAVDAEPTESSPLERLLIHFPEVVERAASELEPHYVVTYITELASDFNSWYASERFIVDGKVSSRTVAVVKAIENTLARGLQVLGIPAPEEM
jgi:arginyl-tRNA synthetase